MKNDLDARQISTLKKGLFGLCVVLGYKARIVGLNFTHRNFADIVSIVAKEIGVGNVNP
jgi:hypothetical protein